MILHLRKDSMPIVEILRHDVSLCARIKDLDMWPFKTLKFFLLDDLLKGLTDE